MSEKEEDNKNINNAVNNLKVKLKNVNDDEGHDAGDKLLIRASALLKLAFGDYEIYRAGGDEFFIFCPDISEENRKRLQDLMIYFSTVDNISLRRMSWRINYGKNGPAYRPMVEACKVVAKELL